MVLTRVFRVNPNNPEPFKIDLAARIILDGGLVAFPTETVYGLGANALNPSAVKKIFLVKGRPLDNPLILHIQHIDDLKFLAKNISRKATKLAREFWPGPLTLVLEKSQRVPQITTGGLDTIAVRIPSNIISLSLIRAAGIPVAAPSANVSGGPSPTRASHVLEDLYRKVDLIIDGGKTRIGLESTVIDMTSPVPVLLRPGGLPLERIREVIGKISIHPSILNPKKDHLKSGKGNKSPGIKYRHYSPKADLILVEGTKMKVRNKIVELARRMRNEQSKSVCIMTKSINNNYIADIVWFVGNDFETISRGLFEIFRYVDNHNIDVIIAEEMDCVDLGLAVMDRLKRAAKEIITV
jgi:L-threonylcarbamoyladenylate synthase